MDWTLVVQAGIHTQAVGADSPIRNHVEPSDDGITALIVE
jgi:hypothetical protein